MSKQRNDGIVWTDETWNPLRGCSRVSAGCVNCYAESMAARFCGPGQPYEGTISPDTKRWNGKIRLVPEKLMEPLRWTRPRRVFVNSMSDLFHPEVPDDFLPEVFAVMAMAKQHTFQVLTKRPERMHEVLNDGIFFEAVEQTVKAMGGVLEDENWPLPNVWLGVTAENQEAADERILLLLQTPAAARWVSVEPMLGPVDLSLWFDLYQYEESDCWRPRNLSRPLHSPDWIVCGGESGPHARPMHPDWARGLRDQCAAAGVPFLFKQWGEWAEIDFSTGEEVKASDEIVFPKLLPQVGERQEGTFMRRIGRKLAGRRLDGVLHDEYPEIAK